MSALAPGDRPTGLRRYAAVMYLDMVGYSALTQRDEPLALRLLDEMRHRVRGVVPQFEGTEIKTIGDAFLLEFGSAEAAVRCGLALQRTLTDADRPEGRIAARIGIHVGAVVHRDGDVYGDAVNVASRLVPLARPGMICVSGPVFDEARTRVEFDWLPLATGGLRGMDVSPEVYQLGPPGASSAPGAPSEAEVPVSGPAGRAEIPLVDRMAEAERLRSFVEEVVEGRGGSLFLTGEPGVGKSRLVRETIGYAHRRGVRTLEARCADLEGAGAYAPWIALLRRVAAEETRQSLTRYCGPFAAELGQACVEVAKKLDSGLAAPASGEPADQRLRFFDAFTEFFRGMARDAPVLIVLEDLLGADPDSLRLMRYAIGRAPGSRLGFLATYPPMDLVGTLPLTDVLLRLHRDGLLRARRLEPLPQEFVLPLVRAVLGSTAIVPPGLSAPIYDKTGGNPFFVGEVARELAESGLLGSLPETALPRGETRIPIPATVRGVVESRLHRLAGDTASLLRIASVLGPEFDIELLGRVAGLSRTDLHARTEEAVRAGLLEERRRPGARTRCRFRDTPIRVILYETLSASRRDSLHGETARALEALQRSRHEDYTAEIAHHYLGAREPGKASVFARRAAARAMRLGAYEEAARALEAALELAGTDSDSLARAALLAALAEAHLAQGMLDPALAELREAAEIERAGGRRKGAATLLRRVVEALWDLSNRSEDFARAFDAARAAAEEAADDRGMARLLARGAVAFSWFGEGERARPMAEKAIELAQVHRLGDTERTACIAICLSASVQDRLRGIEFLDRWKAFVPNETAADRPGLRADESVSAAFTELAARGDWPEAIRMLEAVREAARRARFRERVAYMQYTLSGMYFDTGRCDEARSACDEVEELTRRYGIGSAESQNYLDVRSNRAYYEGPLADARAETLRMIRSLETAAPRYQGLIGFYEFAGRVCAEEGRLEEAADYLERCRRIARAHRFPLYAARDVLFATASLVDVRRRQSREADAERVLTELGGLARDLTHAPAAGFLRRAQGQLALSRSDPARAASAFAEAARGWEAAGLGYWSAVARFDLGMAYRAAGEGARAEVALTEARDRFLAMRLPRWIERAERELEELRGR